MTQKNFIRTGYDLLLSYFSFFYPYFFPRCQDLNLSKFSGKNYNNPFILLDFDGTFVDTLDIIVEEFNIILRQKKDAPISREEFRKHAVEYWLKKNKVSPFVIPLYIEKIKKSLLLSPSDIKLFPDILNLFSYFYNKGFRLGILTSNSCKIVSSFLKENNINIFEFVAESVGITDKDKSIKRIIRRYKLDHHQIIYIADEARDIRSMKKVGIPVIAVTWGWSSEDLLREEKPWGLARTYQELSSYIFKFNNESFKK